MSSLPKLLICDDDSIFQIHLKLNLKDQFSIFCCPNGDDAISIVKSQHIDIVLLDIHMRKQNEGLEYIPKLFETDSQISIIVSSADKNFQTVRQAMKLGAIDYIVKESQLDDLIHTLRKAVEHRTLLRKQQQQTCEVKLNQKNHILIGGSSQILDLKRAIEKVRNSSANVVITGETGTGKEVVARQLRKTFTNDTVEPFLAVDSSTIQSSVAESILFGHEKGAFTGADRTSRGIFEEANGGIVYFDEISNMPLPIQSKLLRVLQEKEITRLGSSKVISLNFRVICATNRNLEDLIKIGEFKADLFQRLNVIPIVLPPLRERMKDLPLLIDHFLKKFNHSTAKIHFSDQAMSALLNYNWPGNIRELQNLIEYLCIMSENPKIQLIDLPHNIRNATAAKFSETPESLAHLNKIPSFYERVSHFESDILSREYNRFHGNISKLATELGMDRSHLYTKLKEYRIHSVSKK